jgi:predicted dehydrogenase
MRQLGIGMIGSGFMGETYAKTIDRHTRGARLLAVTLGTRAQSLAGRYICHHEPDVGSLLRRPDLDAVVICSPHHLHAEHALAAMQAGKHVLLEKPMATSVRDCELILQAAERTGLNLMLAFTQRFRLCNRAAKQLLETDKLGRIQVIEEKQVVPAGIEQQPSFQKEARNLGTTFSHGVHNIDRVRWLTGMEICRVAAISKTFQPVEIESSTVSIFELQNGAIGTFLCSFDCPAPGFPDALSHCRMIGEKGLLVLDAYGEVKVNVGNEWNTVAVQKPIDWVGGGQLSPVRLEAFGLQLQEFINSVQEGRPPSVTGQDGWASARVGEALYESSKSGRHVDLKW